MADVLIIDDEGPFRRVLSRWIQTDGFTVVEAESAEQALVLASQVHPRVALCDIRIPRGQTGVWLIEQLHRFHPDTSIVVMTGLPDFEIAVEGVREWIMDCLVKPFTREHLQRVMAKAFAQHAARKAEFASLGERGCRDAGDSVPTTIGTLLAVLKAQGDVTTRSAVRVSEIAVAVAESLGLGEPEWLDIGRGALLRGVERIDVHGIARKVPFMAAAEAIIASVGERFDGKGFPLGLEGEAIPLGSRIVAAAQAFDTMAGQDGHAGIEAQRAIDLLEQDAGRFDPGVLRALRQVAAHQTLASPA